MRYVTAFILAALMAASQWAYASTACRQLMDTVQECSLPQAPACHGQPAKAAKDCQTRCQAVPQENPAVLKGKSEWLPQLVLDWHVLPSQDLPRAESTAQAETFRSSPEGKLHDRVPLYLQHTALLI